MCQNRALKKIFGLKREEVAGDWKILHNEELHNLYSSPDIIIIRLIKSRRMRWAGHVARMGDSRNSYNILVAKSGWKRPLERPRRRWEDNIRMDLREIEWDSMNWIRLDQDRDHCRVLVNTSVNLLVP
jgi:hypothetical protein